MTKFLKEIAFLVILFLINSSIFLLLWIKSKFGEISLDLLLINIKLISSNIFGDLGSIQNSIAPRLRYWILYWPLFISIFVYSFFKIIDQPSLNKKFKIILHYIFDKITKKSLIFLFLLILIIIFGTTIKVEGYFKSILDSRDYFEESFIKPKLQKKGKQKNLVLIFLESFDIKYLTENKIMSDKEINFFNKIDLKNYEIKKLFNLISSPGTTYSSGSQIASLCGIPLILSTSTTILNKDTTPRSLSVNLNRKFFTKYKCVQDYLNSHKYQTEAIFNTKINFMGTKQFLDSHNFDEVYDNDRLIDEGYDASIYGFMNSVFDGDVLMHTVKRIKYNKLNKKNFFIFSSTVETHPPGTYFNRDKCLIKYKFNKLNKNSAKIINQLNLDKKLLEKLRYIYSYRSLEGSKNHIRESFLCLQNSLKKFFFEIDKLNDEDLTIIILADHSYNYTSSFESNLFNLIIRHKKSINLNSNLDGFFDHYDLFPIILEETLFNVADGKAALGSFNTKYNKRDLLLEEEKLFKILYGQSKLYQSLW